MTPDDPIHDDFMGYPSENALASGLVSDTIDEYIDRVAHQDSLLAIQEEEIRVLKVLLKTRLERVRELEAELGEAYWLLRGMTSATSVTPDPPWQVLSDHWRRSIDWLHTHREYAAHPPAEELPPQDIT